MHGVKEQTREGVPQGGPLSPLLANILLDDFDKELEQENTNLLAVVSIYERLDKLLCTFKVLDSNSRA